VVRHHKEVCMSDGPVPHDPSPPEADSCIRITSAGNIRIEPDAVAKQRLYTLQVNSNRAERHRLCTLLSHLVGWTFGMSIIGVMLHTDAGWLWLIGPAAAAVGGATLGIVAHSKLDDWLCVRPAHRQVYGRIT
jgi:hypothetical protein